MNEEREKQCSGDSSINKLLSIGITSGGGGDDGIDSIPLAEGPIPLAAVAVILTPQTKQ